MNIGIVVEGDHDTAAYPELIRKIRGDDATILSILSIPCGGAAQVRKNFVGWLKHFQWHAQRTVDKALVIIDSDFSDPFAREEKLREAYQQSHFVPTFPVHFHATRREIETWLLADENAINRASQHRGKNKQVAVVTSQLEFRTRAKELFEDVLSKAGLPADPQVYQEIASFVDIQRIAARCPSFQQFIDKVRAC